MLENGVAEVKRIEKLEFVPPEWDIYFDFFASDEVGACPMAFRSLAQDELGAYQEFMQFYKERGVHVIWL